MKRITLADEPDELPLLVCCLSNYIEVNSNKLTSGVPYKGEYIYIKVDNGEPYYADIILSMPSMTPVISPKLASAIKENHFQYGEMIPIFEGFYKDFFVINPIPLINLVDEENSPFDLFNGTKLYYSAKLKDYSGSEGIFRIKNYRSFPFATDGMIQLIKQFDYRGIDFSISDARSVKK